MSMHVYYIIREAVNNAVKHGKAENIVIHVVSGLEAGERVWLAPPLDESTRTTETTDKGPAKREGKRERREQGARGGTPAP